MKFITPASGCYQLVHLLVTALLLITSYNPQALSLATYQRWR